jgi:hypothetical protein
MPLQRAADTISIPILTDEIQCNWDSTNNVKGYLKTKTKGMFSILYQGLTIPS